MSRLEDDQPFIYVKNKRRKKFNPKSGNIKPLVLNHGLPIDKLISNVDHLSHTIDLMVCNTIVEAATMQDLHSTSNGEMLAKQIICYGLGSPSSNRNSRAQLAVLLQLIQALKCPNVFLYDPVFEANDKKLFDNYKLFVLGKNEECLRAVNERTIFYMPHCCWAMYNNVLWANWTPKRLANVVFVGNNIQNKAEAECDSTFKSMYRFICDSLERDMCEVIALPSLNKGMDSFEDTAVIVFHPGRFPIEDKLFWKRGPKPDYKGAHFGELIEKSKLKKARAKEDELTQALKDVSLR
ncbi:hypothetical protein HAZT_HAZT005797 [Hyalella azteca]|uniref:SRR1-like protein n=1 Tax=Hyalella azteca TaxID=294128 RepID=A0A6A0H7P5_HYAAZ|nr:SRR1-like protein [Hyalella azteca]KAA0201763.1 hypothetical protein HAZT_HAZT005797 [Hyalella azteca]